MIRDELARLVGDASALAAEYGNESVTKILERIGMEREEFNAIAEGIREYAQESGDEVVIETPLLIGLLIGYKWASVGYR